MPKFLNFYKKKCMEQKGRDIRNNGRKNNYSTGRTHQTKFGRWSLKEVEKLLAFKGVDRALSKILGRSVQAIQIKRSRAAPQKYKEARNQQATQKG